MRLLIATWGEPSAWSKVPYEFEGRREESCSTLGLLNKVLQPDKTIVIASDTLVAKKKEIKKCEEQRRNAETAGELELPELNYKAVVDFVKNYIRKTAEVFNAKVDDVWVVPSVGFFSNATVEGNFADFRYSLFVYFFNNFEELIKGDTLEVYLDITHGQNFLPTFTNEVLNTVLSIAAYFVKEVKLSVLISDPFIYQSRPEVLKIHKVFDGRPVTPQPYRFYAEKLNFLGNFQGKRNLRDIMVSTNKVKREIPIDLRNRVPAFLGAIYNALPLMVFYGYVDPHYISDLLNFVVKKYEENISIEDQNGKIFVKRSLKFMPELEVYSVYGMYLKGLQLKYGELVNTIHPKKIKDNGVPFEFLKIIKNLWSFNEKDEVIIEKEVGSLEKEGDIERKVKAYLEQKGVLQFDWIKFKNLEEAEREKASESPKEQEKNDSQPFQEYGYPERNFLAHAGLAKNVIEVKFENEKLFIRYDINNGEVNIWEVSAKGLKPLEEKKK